MSRLGGITSLVLGIVFLMLSYQFPLGELAAPGPGMWPLIASVVIVVSSVVVLVTERDDEDYERFTSNVLTIGLGLLSLGAFILLFEQIGFIVPSFLILVLWLRFIGKESWRLTLILSGTATMAFYVVFVVLLGVPFPSGIFGL